MDVNVLFYLHGDIPKKKGDAGEGLPIFELNRGIFGDIQMVVSSIAAMVDDRDDGDEIVGRESAIFEDDFSGFERYFLQKLIG